MSKKLQLSIPTPCHENWDNMNPVEKGRFCGSCQKQVVDFSDMNDRQIAEFFKKPSTGSVCGRFMTDQLDRDIAIPKKRIPWLKYFFQILLPAFFISKAAGQNPKMGKIAAPTTTTKDTVRIPDNELRTLGIIARPICTEPLKGDVVILPVKEKAVKQIDVKGKVVDEEGNPIPLATILLVNNKSTMTTDEEGNFSFRTTLPPDLIQLEVSSVGYKTEIYKYPFTFGYTSEVDITIQLSREPQLLPEVVLPMLTGITGKIICTRTVGEIVFVKKDTVLAGPKKDSIVSKEIKPVVDENRLIVYPNPVLSGTSINLSFTKLEEGYYLLQLLNQAGQIIQNKEIWIDQEAGVLNVEVPTAASGSYFLVLANKKSGKKFTEKIIIQ